MFNMGYDTMSKFVHTVVAINSGDWKTAMNGLSNSIWYKQVGHDRADRIIAALAVS